MKPLKRFTPPPHNNNRRTRNGISESENDYSESDEEERYENDDVADEEAQHTRSNGDCVRASDKSVDEFLQQSQSAARAKELRAKFESWESKEIIREQNNSSVILYDGDDQSLVESAKE